MNEREFITFARSITEANGSSNPKAMVFFRGIANGMGPITVPPPKGDENAMDGYEIGVEVSKSLK